MDIVRSSDVKDTEFDSWRGLHFLFIYSFNDFNVS